MGITLTEIQLLDFLLSLFKIEPTVDQVTWGTDKIINIEELGIHITFDLNSGGYIDNLRMSDSGENFGYFLFLDCSEGVIHIENKQGVITQGIQDELYDVFRDIHGFFMQCENPLIKAKLRDIKIDELLK